MPTSMPSSCYEPHGLSVELHSILWPSQMAHHWIHRISPLDFWNVSWWCALWKIQDVQLSPVGINGVSCLFVVLQFLKPTSRHSQLGSLCCQDANSRQHWQPTPGKIHLLCHQTAKMQQNRNRKHRNLLVMNLGTLILVKFPIQRKQENLHCHPQFLNSFNYVFFMAPENLQSSFARKRQPSVFSFPAHRSSI